MADFARDLYIDSVAEPFRTKVVEHLRLPERSERERLLREAFYSPAYLDSADTFIDLVTDSGTGAMSQEQWAALMRGDEAYIRSRSFVRFERAVQEVLGFEYVIPTHQGRGAENIVMELMATRGKIVLSNTHFDTTKAHVEHRGAMAIDLTADSAFEFAEARPFKGNFDLNKLSQALEKYGNRVDMIVITVLNNMACSSPVSMENIRETSRLAAEHGIPVFFDACRFAENAYFIKMREAGYASKSILEIVREMMSYGQGCWMSAKKDAIVNTGGFIATRDESFCRRCQERLVLYEGFPTYGGLARRDLEAIAVGLWEGIDEEYLSHRVRQVAYLGELLASAGLKVSQPVGGSGVFVDVQDLYPQLRLDQWPGIALFSDFYVEGGIRVGAAAFPVRTLTSEGAITERMFPFARFAVPRRVYGKAHLDFVGKIAARVKEIASGNRGYRTTHMPEILAHFFAKFEPLRD